MFLHYFPTTLQLHNALGDCARELFKCSEYAASLLDCYEKYWEVLDSRLHGPGPQLQDGIF